MPLYTYKCEAEEKTFTKLYVTFTEAEPFEDAAECPFCGKTAKRLLDASAVKFVGGGFYATEYQTHSPNTPASLPPIETN